MSEQIEKSVKMVSVSESELESIVNLIEQQREEIHALYEGSIKLLTVIGLAENGRIKAEAFEEGGNAIPEILKGASSIIGLVMQAGVPVIGKKAEKKLQEQFSFFVPLIPLFIKYGNEFSPVIPITDNVSDTKLLNE